MKWMKWLRWLKSYLLSVDFLKIMPDTGPTLISETFGEFCREVNIQQSIMSYCQHQNNGQVEACIKLAKCTIQALTLNSVSV